MLPRSPGPGEIAEAQRQINGKSSRSRSDKHGRGKFAIGGERKIGRADVHLRFRDVTPARRGPDGLYRVLVHTDRLGHLHRPKAADSVRRERPRHARDRSDVRARDERLGKERAGVAAEVRHRAGTAELPFEAPAWERDWHERRATPEERS